MIRFRFPFNWRHPFLYLIAFSIEYMVLNYVCMFSATLICFMIKTLYLLITLVKDIEASFAAINKIELCRWTAFKRLSESIQLYSEANRLNKFFIFHRVIHQSLMRIENSVY